MVLNLSSVVCALIHFITCYFPKLTGEKTWKKNLASSEGFSGDVSWDVKNTPANRRHGLISGSGIYLEKGNGNPFQYSYPGICMDRGAWWASVYAVAELDTTEWLFCFVCSVALLCPTLWDSMYPAPGFPILHHPPELAQTRVQSQWCHPTISSSVVPFSSCLLSFPASGSFPMSWKKWPMYWIFSFSISPSNEYSGLISFKIDWFDLFAVQRTLKSLLQHHSWKASVLWHSTFFTVKLTIIHDYWKNYSFDYSDFVDKVMSLLFNTLSRFVIAFLPRSKRLLISWLQSTSAMILESKKVKSVLVSIVSPSICHEVMGPDTWSSFYECWALSQFCILMTKQQQIRPRAERLFQEAVPFVQSPEVGYEQGRNKEGFLWRRGRGQVRPKVSTGSY